jgi:hypothetical protein
MEIEKQDGFAAADVSSEEAVTIRRFCRSLLGPEKSSSRIVGGTCRGSRFSRLDLALAKTFYLSRGTQGQRAAIF